MLYVTFGCAVRHIYKETFNTSHYETLFSQTAL